MPTGQRKRTRSGSTSITNNYTKRSKTPYRGKQSQPSLVYYQNRNNIPRWGFPRRLYIAHRYVESVNLLVTGSVNGIAFKANGLFDPNTQVGGHQPMFFDNMANIYNHYTVVKSTMKLTVVPTDNTVVGYRRVALYVDDDGTPGSSLEAAAEMGGSSMKVIPTGVSEPTVLYCSWSARSTFGGDPLSNDQLQGTGSSDPVELSQYMIRADGTPATNQTLVCTVELVYYTIWDEIKSQEIN